MTIELRRADARPATREDGRSTFHSFAFGAHYDPENVGFAAMTAHNDENLDPGAGYAPHPHRDIEIVTWVLAGALRHTDGDGRSALLGPGELLRTSAGSGIVHSEVAEPGTGARFLQTWLRPDQPGGDPSFAGTSVGALSGLVEVVGPDGVLSVGTSAARLHLATAATGALLLPASPRLHVFLVDGAARIGDRMLAAGDAARLLDEGGRTLHIEGAATVSVWSFVN